MSQALIEGAHLLPTSHPTPTRGAWGGSTQMASRCCTRAPLGTSPSSRPEEDEADRYPRHHGRPERKASTSPQARAAADLIHGERLEARRQA
jgi:hypothetical protein